VQPVRLAANQPELFYRGGDSIARLRGVPLRSVFQPEDWIASTTAIFGTDSGRTVLPDGRSLADAIATDPVSYLGPDHVAQYGSDSALLVKYLDAGERLPVHLHPPRAFAQEHLGCAHGKSEAWIVVGTTVPNPEVYLGFKDAVSAGTLADLVAGQVPGELLAALNVLPVKVGDVIFVPAGTPHSISGGVFIVELQEPTDFSIMMEFARYGIDGAARGSLGLGFAVALTCVDRTPWDADRLARTYGPGWGADGSTRKDTLPPQALDFFRAEVIRPGAGAVELEASFAVLVALEGSGTLRTATGGELTIETGNTILVPHASGASEVSGDVTLIRCQAPLPPDQR
jgi:mannose-6-phosphate isomerase